MVRQEQEQLPAVSGSLDQHLQEKEFIPEIKLLFC